MTDPRNTFTDEELAAQSEGVWSMIPVTRAMEWRLTGLGRGYCAATIPLGPNINHFQMMYAGSLFTVAELLGGALSLNTFDVGAGYVPLVKEMSIKFRRPAGSAVVAESSLSEEEIERVVADADATGKGEFVLVATITDEAGTVVAQTEGVYQLRKM